MHKKRFCSFISRKKCVNVCTISQKCTEIVLVKLPGKIFWFYCLLYVPLHFTIRQWYGKSSFSVYSLGQIQKVLCTDNTLGLEDNTESIYFFFNLFCDNIGETGPPLVNSPTMHRRVVCKDPKIHVF